MITKLYFYYKENNFVCARIKIIILWIIELKERAREKYYVNCWIIYSSISSAIYRQICTFITFKFLFIIYISISIFKVHEWHYNCAWMSFKLWINGMRTKQINSSIIHKILKKVHIKIRINLLKFWVLK